MLEVAYFVNKFSKRSLESVDLNRGLTWINIQNPSDSELSKLAKKIRITASDLKFFMDPVSRPRIEELKNWSLIIFRAPVDHNKKDIASVAILLSKNAVITLSEKPIEAIENVNKLPDSRKIKFFNNGAEYFFFRLLDEILAVFFDMLSDVEEKAGKIEHTILKEPEKSIIDDLFKVKKIITILHRALLANREVIAGIEKGYSRFVTKPNLIYFRELYHDCVQLIELEDTQRDILTGLTDIHLSVTSHNLNKIVKTLTIVAAFVWIPALIAGIYGMNFFASEHPLAMPEISWVYGYPFALILMAVSVIAIALAFKKKGWL